MTAKRGAVVRTTFHLTAAEAAVLHRSVVGDGGLQRFFRDLQAAFDPEAGVVRLTDAEIGRLWRMMAYANGGGGFQGRLRRVFARVLRDPLWFEPSQRTLLGAAPFTPPPMSAASPPSRTPSPAAPSSPLPSLFPDLSPRSVP